MSEVVRTEVVGAAELEDRLQAAAAEGWTLLNVCPDQTARPLTDSRRSTRVVTLSWRVVWKRDGS